MKNSTKFLLASIALAASSMASAQWYGGVGAGVSNTSFSEDYSTNTADISESTAPRGVGLKVLAGYELTPTWAVEASYAHLGTGSYKYSFMDQGAQADVRHESVTLAVKGTLPVADKWSMIGKLGVAYNRSELTASSSIPSLNADFAGMSSTVNTQSVVMGVGAEYALTRADKIRVEYEDFGDFGNASDTGRTSSSAMTVSWVRAL